MAMLDDIKTSMRITHNSLDNEISRYIKAAFSEMDRAGVGNCTEQLAGQLQKICVEFYIKHIYDYDGKGERWESQYKRLRDSLCLSLDYSAPLSVPAIATFKKTAQEDLIFRLNKVITGVANGETDLSSVECGYHHPYLTVYSSYLSTLANGTVTITIQALNGTGEIPVIVGD